MVALMAHAVSLPSLQSHSPYAPDMCSAKQRMQAQMDIDNLET